MLATQDATTEPTSATEETGASPTERAALGGARLDAPGRDGPQIDAPQIDAPSAEPDPPDAVERVTTRVTTRTLEERGIASLRIVSESAFSELLRLLGSRAHDGARSEEAPPRDDPEPAPLEAPAPSRLVPEYDARWGALREAHGEKLRRIESLVSRLSRRLRGLERLVDCLEGDSLSPRWATAEISSLERLRRRLIREMLLGSLPLR